MDKFFNKTKSAVSVLGNMYSNLNETDLSYVTESHDWVIHQIGISVAKILNKGKLLKTRTTRNAHFLHNQIVHFGSVNMFFGTKKLHLSNKHIISWFHIIPGSYMPRKMAKLQNNIKYVHTAANSTKNQLIKEGVSSEKIKVIPLGVNLNLFYPVSPKEKQNIKKELRIPNNRFVIGSFQKDGVGWGEGLEPKSIKGPDIFVDTISRLKKYKPFVLLTGPARGYVKKELEKNDISYKHVQLNKFVDVAKMYRALDLYIVASRVEGGPKAILESWASGVPIVSTKVGMVPDIAADGKNILTSDVEDVEGLVNQSERLINDKSMQNRLIQNGLQEVQKYSWDKITRRYYNELYKPLINK